MHVIGSFIYLLFDFNIIINIIILGSAGAGENVCDRDAG